jgi:GNAT superfamily N-acetyltransferase
MRKKKISYTGRFALSVQTVLDFSDISSSYDLQVSESSQRHGLGRTLMNHLSKIGADFGMDKIMLTVFKGF